jgi:mRNA interferase MazF
MATARHTRKARHSVHPKRGEIYLAALDPTLGPEVRKTRPALVVQNDTSNRYDATIMVAPITSTVRFPISPVHVLLPAGPYTGLAVPSVAVFSQIRAVDHTRLMRKLGEASAEAMIEVDRAIHVGFGLTCLELGPSGPTITKAISESVKGLKTGRYEP